MKTPDNLDQNLRADEDQPENTADNASVDGRIAGVPPTYDDSEDPSAQEAHIQEREAKERS